MQGLKSVNPDIPGAVSTEMLRAFAVFDGLTRFVMPLCSAVTDRPDPDKVVTKTLMIADISGLGMRQLWNLKGYLQDFSRLLALNYPEILDRVLVGSSCSCSAPGTRAVPKRRIGSMTGEFSS